MAQEWGEWDAGCSDTVTSHRLHQRLSMRTGSAAALVDWMDFRAGITVEGSLRQLRHTCSFRVTGSAVGGRDHRLPISLTGGYRRLTFMMLDRDIVAVSPRVPTACSRAPHCSIAGSRSPRLKAPALCSRSPLLSTGTSMSAISTSPRPSSTSSRCSTVALSPSFTGSCARP